MAVNFHSNLGSADWPYVFLALFDKLWFLDHWRMSVCSEKGRKCLHSGFPNSDLNAFSVFFLSRWWFIHHPWVTGTVASNSRVLHLGVSLGNPSAWSRLDSSKALQRTSLRSSTCTLRRRGPELVECKGVDTPFISFPAFLMKAHPRRTSNHQMEVQGLWDLLITLNCWCWSLKSLHASQNWLRCPTVLTEITIEMIILLKLKSLTLH